VAACRQRDVTSSPGVDAQVLGVGSNSSAERNGIPAAAAELAPPPATSTLLSSSSVAVAADRASLSAGPIESAPASGSKISVDASGVISSPSYCSPPTIKSRPSARRVTVW
jgi:hypothetical protein